MGGGCGDGGCDGVILGLMDYYFHVGWLPNSTFQLNLESYSRWENRRLLLY